jgi:hypothetical protein
MTQINIAWFPKNFCTAMGCVRLGNRTERQRSLAFAKASSGL